MVIHVAEMCVSPYDNRVYSKYLAAKLNTWLPDISHCLQAAEIVPINNNRKFSHSLMPRLRAPPGEKRSGERSRISWAYYPNMMTNEIVRLVIIT